MADLIINPAATWARAALELSYAWQKNAGSGFLRPHMFISGPSGTGKSALAAAIASGLGLDRTETHQTTLTEEGLFLECFRPALHKLLILEECTAATLTRPRLSLLKSILGGQNFPLRRPNGDQEFCWAWYGLCIMISSEPYQRAFGEEASTFAWRLINLPADVPNMAPDLKIETKQEVYEEWLSAGLRRDCACYVAECSLFDGPTVCAHKIDVKDEARD